jgi:O-antigen/teichoic acid export membrane protein
LWLTPATATTCSHATSDLGQGLIDLMAGPEGAGLRAGEPREVVTGNRSLSRMAMARLAADIASLVLGLVAAVITARWLGPADKGTFSTLTFLSGLMMLVCTLGLGDAAIVELNRRRGDPSRVIPATIAGTAALAAGGVVLLMVVCRLQFGEGWDHVRTAVAIAASGLPLAIYAMVLGHILNAEERIVLTSGATVVTAAITTAGLFVFIVNLHLGIAGGALASVAGSGAGLAVLIAAAGPTRRFLRPRWDGAYLAKAARFGAAVQLSYVLLALSGRLDLLLVYGLLDDSAAGQYSVALTAGTLVSYAPFAIVYATFPRLATVDDPAARGLTGEAFRLGTAAALLGGAMLAALIPLLLPVLFGPAYRPAVVPALILLPGGILISSQLILARARAARGSPGLLVRTFSVSVGAMVLADLVVIPRWGIKGAAIASSVSSALGLAVAVAAYRRTMPPAQSLRELLLPMRADFVAVLSSAVNVPLQLLRRR